MYKEQKITYCLTSDQRVGMDSIVEENDGYDNLSPFNTRPHYDVQESN